MGSLSRKVKRNKEKEAKKDMKEKVKLFSKIPEFCNMCEKPFDKTDKDQVKSWRVVVREKQEKVNLYCPPCWDQANELLGSIMEKLQGDKNEGDA